MCDQDVVSLLKYVPGYREIEVYVENGVSFVEMHMMEVRLSQDCELEHSGDILMDKGSQAKYRQNDIQNASVSGVKAEKYTFMELDGDLLQQDIVVDDEEYADMLDELHNGNEDVETEEAKVVNGGDESDFHHEEDEIPPTELEVDMNDFRFQVDAHIDHIMRERKKRLKHIRKEYKGKRDIKQGDFFVCQEFASRKQVTYRVRVLAIESRRAIKVLKYDKERVRAKCYGIVIGYGTGKHGHDELNSTPTKSANITCSSNLKAKFRTYKTFKDKKGIKVKRGKPICPWTLHVSKCGRLCLEVSKH
ncbi:hypothetical protein Tco_0742628 [Tanacetum coccineum]